MKGKTPRFVHTASFKRKFGVRSSREEINKEIPVEQGKFLKDKIDAMWTRQEAEAEWLAAIASAEVADYKGRHGSARYWLPQDTERTKEKEVFVDGAMEETSDQIKNATKEQRAALAKFAHTSAGDCSAAFFHGQQEKFEDPGEHIAKLLGRDATTRDANEVEGEAASASASGGLPAEQAVRPLKTKSNAIYCVFRSAQSQFQISEWLSVASVIWL